MDNERFIKTINKILSEKYETGKVSYSLFKQYPKQTSDMQGYKRDRKGIGTISEKTIHAVLKNYYEPDEEYHEVPVCGHIADIFSEDTIIEIQTANFNKLRNKLKKYLQLYKVTVVYPIPRNKWLIWIDENTGECTVKRKSPKKGTPYEAFRELYKIKNFLLNSNISIQLVMMDVEEYRVLNGWNQDKKKGSTRFDRIPLEIVEEIIINEPRDYMQLLPFELPDKFTTKDYSKAGKVSRSVASIALNILFYTGTIEKIGKNGNSILYQVKE